MKPERRDRAIAETQESAAAFVEDLAHVREVLGRQTLDRGEIRRLSAVMRRFLVDGDLSRIAAPRIGRLMLTAPDNKTFYRLNEIVPFVMFSSGGVQLFTMKSRAFSILPRSLLPSEFKNFSDTDPERMVELTIDNFLKQRVICIRGDWIDRRLAIKHIAHHASGVHSQGVLDSDNALAARARSVASVSLVSIENEPLFAFEASALEGDPPPFVVNPIRMDCVLYEVFTSASFLASSPGVIELERRIQTDG